VTVQPSPTRKLIAMGIVLGLISGLLEGLVHMGLQRLGVLDNSWYPIIWIAASFNALIVGGAGLLAAAVVSSRPHNPVLRWMAVFSLFFLAMGPVLALALKEWIYTYAIALLLVGMSVALTRWQLGQSTWTFASSGVLRWTAAAALIAFALIEGGSRIQEKRATDRLAPADPSSPDVLLIIVDTLRADHLSSYGYGRKTSPAIDGLASGGVLFENSFATSSYTLPSHVSILTGQFPRQHKVEWDNSHHWPPPLMPTFAELMYAKGYRTGAFSANTFYFTREHGFGRGYLHFEDFFHSLPDMWWRTAYGAIATRLVRRRLGWEDLPARKRADTVSRSAADWIAGDSDHPFFVTLNYMDTHDPYLPPEPYRSRFATRPDPGGLINAKWHIPRSLSAEDLQSEQDAYDGAIAFVDDEVGRLLSDIRGMRRSRSLLVIVTSDHGEEFGEHGGFLHQRHLYREVIHVPLIMWGPGVIPSGKRVSQPVSNASIPATVLDVIGAAQAFPSASLQPLWNGMAESFSAALSELKHMPWAFPRDAQIRLGSMRSLVSPALHYIERDGAGPELFEWVTDPREANNVVGRADLQEALELMRKWIGK
jgi:arylsulfatase A-like enzyme